MTTRSKTASGPKVLTIVADDLTLQDIVDVVTKEFPGVSPNDIIITPTYNKTINISQK